MADTKISIRSLIIATTSALAVGISGGLYISPNWDTSGPAVNLSMNGEIFRDDQFKPIVVRFRSKEVEARAKAAFAIRDALSRNFSSVLQDSRFVVNVTDSRRRWDFDYHAIIECGRQLERPIDELKIICWVCVSNSNSTSLYATSSQEARARVSAVVQKEVDLLKKAGADVDISL